MTGAGAQTADHDALKVVAADPEPAHADAAKPLAHADAQHARADAIDARRAGDRDAERQTAHVAVAPVLVRRPDGGVHAVHLLQRTVAEVEPEPDDARHVADADADVIDGEVETLGERGERRDERQRYGA